VNPDPEGVRPLAQLPPESCRLSNVTSLKSSGDFLISPICFMKSAIVLKPCGVVVYSTPSCVI
jgi:hypothetical protein